MLELPYELVANPEDVATEKERRETDHLVALLIALEMPVEQSFPVTKRERPDFEVRFEAGIVGVEMTELLDPASGPLRRAENWAVRAIAEVAEQEIGRIGGLGAEVFGNCADVEKLSKDAIESFRYEFAKHLRDNLDALSHDGGQMHEHFQHAAASVTAVIRRDAKAGVTVYGDFLSREAAHKTPVGADRIEEMALERLASKVAKRYTFAGPMWLALRNRNEPLRSVCPETRVAAERANKGRFRRVIIFNDTEDVRDISPPKPRFFDLLSSETAPR